MQLGVLTQEEAKKTLPPGASIWRMTTSRQGWAGHMKPFSRVSCTFEEAGGANEAVREVQKLLWWQYLKLKVVHLSKCPVNGLFDEEDIRKWDEWWDQDHH